MTNAARAKPDAAQTKESVEESKRNAAQARTNAAQTKASITVAKTSAARARAGVAQEETTVVQITANVRETRNKDTTQNM